jgi:hypothetical protein
MPTYLAAELKMEERQQLQIALFPVIMPVTAADMQTAQAINLQTARFLKITEITAAEYFLQQ